MRNPANDRPAQTAILDFAYAQSALRLLAGSILIWINAGNAGIANHPANTLWHRNLCEGHSGMGRCSVLPGQPSRKSCTRLPREGGPLRAILSSLTAFLAAGLRPRTPLAKAIVLVLIIKLIGIAGMKVFLFADSAQPVVDAAVMARVIGVPTPRQ
jgi:hypothetical protein